MRKLISKKIILLLLGPLLIGNSVSAQVMSSNTYSMQSDSLNIAGVLSSSPTYNIEDTGGESGSGTNVSTSFGANLGYQYMYIDTTSPTVPSSLTAQTISSSQVELSWNAATDAYGVERYYVYRNNSRVADVASFPLGYSDTGLTALTAYNYNVSAVDVAGNESARSGTTTVTTPALSIVSTSGSSSSGGRRNIEIRNFNISSNDVNALVTFTTSLPMRAEISWGKDITYKDGYLSGVSAVSHQFLLTNLIPETFYNIKIGLRDNYGNFRSFENIYFRTLTMAVSQAPTNVDNFFAVATPSTIELSWKLPKDKKVVGATVVRSENSYPSTPEDGRVIFAYNDGIRVESFSDKEVVPGKEYFYTIFTEDLSGNFSSGVVVNSKILLSGEIQPVSPVDRLVPAGNVDPRIEKLTVKDFLFIQSGDSVEVSKDSLSIDGSKNLTVALRYYRVPQVLKTIAVTLLTNEKIPRRFTFILRPNKDMTRYEATIGALGDSARYGLRIDIIDFKNQGLKSLKGSIEVKVLAKDSAIQKERVKGLVGLGALGILLAFFANTFFHRKSRKFQLINTATGDLMGSQ